MTAFRGLQSSNAVIARSEATKQSRGLGECYDVDFTSSMDCFAALAMTTEGARHDGVVGALVSTANQMFLFLTFPCWAAFTRRHVHNFAS